MDDRNHKWRMRRYAGWCLCAALSGLLPAVASHAFPSLAFVEQRELLDRRVPGGSLMIVGGGDVTPAIRSHFVELAGGPKARIVLIPGSDPGADGVQALLSPWKSSGVSSIILINARDRAMANDPAFCEPLKQATGVWFGGGYQGLLADRYVDTTVQQCLHDVLKRNGVVGGCSAGAALLSRVMIRDGDAIPVEARGLDLLSNAIVDQHFLARNRLWRLEQMLEAHPDLVGLGIDEATALAIHLRSWRMTVVGESYVVACLPRSPSQAPRIEILKPGDDVTLAQLREDHLTYNPAADWNVVAGNR
ncbi:MAG: cyanophycinase [Deltaproteobacteria bacterium]